MSSRFAALAAALGISLVVAGASAAPVELKATISGRYNFGFSVAQDKRWIFVGDPAQHDTGKLWIYEKTATGPVLRQMLDGGDALGCGMALSGDELAVTECTGPALRIYAFDGTKWAEKTKLSEVPVYSSEPGAMGVAWDGPDKLIVGRLKFPVVSLYQRTGTTWARTGEIAAGFTATDFGTTIRVFGEQLAIVGLELVGGSPVGHVQLFKRSGATWVKDGPSFPGVTGGYATTIDKIGSQWLVGDPAATVGGRIGAGAVYVFSLVSGAWNLDQTLVSTDPQPNGAFGSVATSGAFVAVSDPGALETRNLVHADVWKQVAPRKMVPSNPEAAPFVTSLFGSTLVVGAPTLSGDGSVLVIDLACTADADCGSGTYCDATGLCVAGAPPAATCDRDRMCASGFCTDGVCCESRCEGICEACDVSGSAGKCIPAAGPPHRTITKRPLCPGDAADACSARQCDGVARTTCAKLAGSELTCRPASCTGTTLVAPALCDGSGKCPALVSSGCGGYICETSAPACKTSCATRFDCAEGYACRAGACTKLEGTCGPDGASVIASDGVTTSCNGFVCVEGACLTKCTQTTDCGAAKVCDVASATCVDGAAPVDSGGGCAFERPRRTTGLALLLLLGVGLVARRRSSAGGAR